MHTRLLIQYHIWRHSLNFTEKLDLACQSQQSMLCVGLDPDPRLMPVKNTLEFNKSIIHATHDLVCAYKPNLAFYEALGLPGLRALEGTIDYIRSVNPHLIIIADAKRGDIGNTASAYARALFDVWDVDAATVNPYLGTDSLEPFLSRPDRVCVHIMSHIKYWLFRNANAKCQPQRVPTASIQMGGH